MENASAWIWLIHECRHSRIWSQFTKYLQPIFISLIVSRINKIRNLKLCNKEIFKDFSFIIIPFIHRKYEIIDSVRCWWLRLNAAMYIPMYNMFVLTFGGYAMNFRVDSTSTMRLQYKRRNQYLTNLTIRERHANTFAKIYSQDLIEHNPNLVHSLLATMPKVWQMRSKRPKKKHTHMIIHLQIETEKYFTNNSRENLQWTWPYCNEYLYYFIWVKLFVEFQRTSSMS